MLLCTIHQKCLGRENVAPDCAQVGENQWQKNGGPDRPPRKMNEESSPFGSRCGAYRTFAQVPANLPCRNGISRTDAFSQQTYAMRLRSEEHTSELQSPMRKSYAVVC